mgnify:CR=1 FL=1
MQLAGNRHLATFAQATQLDLQLQPSDGLVAGEFILIAGTKTNDSLYKIATVSATELTLDPLYDLIPETQSFGF